MHYRMHRTYKIFIHLFAIMLTSIERLRSVYEIVNGHIDMRSGKVSEMEDTFYDNLEQIMPEHTRSLVEILLRLGFKVS